jgi:hypothetical protein
VSRVPPALQHMQHVCNGDLQRLLPIHPGNKAREQGKQPALSIITRSGRPESGEIFSTLPISTYVGGRLQQVEPKTDRSRRTVALPNFALRFCGPIERSKPHVGYL